MVDNMPPLSLPRSHVCEACILGKMHRYSFPKDGSVRASRKLQLIHSDVCGPMATPSYAGYSYFCTFIDDFTRFAWVVPLRNKSDVLDAFQTFVTRVELESECKVETLHSDRGGEYMSHALRDFCHAKGIKHQGYFALHTATKWSCRAQEQVINGNG